MARKNQTILTLSVRMTIPKGSNAAEALEIVRDGIKSRMRVTATTSPNPTWSTVMDTVTVNLVKKEVSYG